MPTPTPSLTAGSGVPELARTPAVELLRRYRSGDVSPVEVHDAVHDVIEAREPVLNAFWTRDPDASREDARASEKRWRNGDPCGPLDGVPITLKENIARRGVPMPAGNAGVEPPVPDRDAPVTERVLEAGAVVLGSTVMPDWGMLSSGVSSRHGITRSPWNPGWTTGGSSSGAGAAAAGGYGPLHVGTDIGGSIRLPGTWLGLAALKPSAGRVALDAPYLGRAAGPLTRTVADTALLMSVIGRPDPDERDWTGLPSAELTGVSWELDGFDPRTARIGLHLDAGCGAPAAPEVIAAITRVGEQFAAAGAEVEPLPAFMTPDLLTDLDQFWRVRSWNDYAALPVERQRLVLPFIVDWVRGGADVSGTRVLQCYQAMMEIQRRTVAATRGFDLVLSPVAPVPAFPAEQPMPFTGPGQQMSHIGFTVPFNMSGQPAISLNCGSTPDGRPIGVQLAARRFDDAGLLRAAAWYERTRPDDARPSWPDGEPQR